MVFDPYHLDTTASLNRLRIMDLPGIPEVHMVSGKTGYELLSLPALLQIVNEYAAELALPAILLKADPRHMPRLLADCLASPEQHIKQTAHSVVQILGQRLGLLLLTLKRGDAINRAARTDWTSAVWDYWQTIETVYIGGGLASGQLGTEMVHYAQELIDTSTDAPLQVRCSDYGSYLPLIGAARHTPPGLRQSAVFDFGGSFVKRAIAQFEKDRLTSLDLLPPIPSQWTSGKAADEQPEQNTYQLFKFMLNSISDTLKAHPAPAIGLSMAAYIHDGQPISRQGGAYAHLNRLSPNLQEHLSQALTQHLGTPVTARLLHDGTAAATAYAGLPNAAVIMIGSALGIGYVPPATGFRSVGENVLINQKDQ